MRMSPDQASWVEAAFDHPAFLVLRGRAAPSLILDVDPLRVVWANTGAAAVLGAADAATLTRRLRDGLGRELAGLARALQPGAAPRLQRLRIARAPASLNLTILCCRPTGPEASRIVLAVVGPSLVVRAASGEPAAWEDSLVVPGPEDINEMVGTVCLEEPEPVPGPLQQPAPSFQAELQNLREELGAGSKWRFLWQTDAVGSALADRR